MEYFKSYEDLEVHKLMLEDTARNESYQKAIVDNKATIQGKTVLDIGAGTGILSIFCAQAGAACVYAIEASEFYEIAEQTVRENNLQNIIQVIHTRVEDFSLPGDAKVDVIVSEWMGHFLLHEGMLDSVIFARDKFLKPGGMMLPENATLYCAPCSVPSFYDYWNDVSGVSMQHFSELLRSQTCKTPKILSVKQEELLSEPDILLWIDLREVTLEDVKHASLQHIAVADKVGQYQGICLWFSCGFPSLFTEPVLLSTSPEDPSTHWKQTVVVLPVELTVEVGTPISYDITIKRCIEDSRKFSLEVEMLDSDEVQHPEYCGCYQTKCILAKAVLEQYEENSSYNKPSL